MTELIKNVYSFANILSQAGTEVVGHWDLKSLENAFNWARYCEQVVVQTQGKSYREKLKGQIQSLTLLLTPVSVVDLSLDRLQYAVVYLAMILLDNPSLPNELRKTVQQELENGSGEELKIKPRRKDGKDRSLSRSLYYLLGNDPSLPGNIDDQATVVIQRLARLKMASRSIERYYRFLEEFLEKLTSEQSGWEITLNMLLTESETDEDHWQMEEIKCDMMKYILQHAGLKSSLWKVNKDLILEVCSRDDQFYKIYQQSLINWAESMEPVYGKTVQGDLYRWCYEGKGSEDSCLCSDSDDISVRHCCCYNTLVRHLCDLLRHGKRKRDFEDVIIELSKRSHFNVWTDILKSVKERLKSLPCD